jgi:AraC-like DNA-binding protein
MTDTFPASLPFALLDAALRGALVALLAVLAVLMCRDRHQSGVARVGVAMALGLCVQVISSTPWFELTVPRLWQAPWVAVSVGNAVLFWVFVEAIFDDEFALRPVHVAAWLAAVALSGVNCAVLANSASILAPVTMGLQRAIPLVFSILAALAAARHWRADLVEERRRLRGFVTVTGIAYTLVFLGVRLGSPHGQLLGWAATLDVAVLLLIVAVVVLNMLRLGNTNLFTAARPIAHPHGPTHTTPVEQICQVPPPAAVSAGPDAGDLPAPTPDTRPDPAEDRLALALQHLMEVEHAYRAEDMSLASLASRLSVPEYRLRRLINLRLGHRNFNAFINGYRLDAVCAALADPARQDLPVLTLALDAGFQSIGPFNRAFKAATGLTPTEFRKRLIPLADKTGPISESG